MRQTVTIFIPVKNGSDFIEETIQSIQTQTFRNWRLVIKDNCSTDNTRDIVAKYLNDPRISLEARESDVGALQNYNSCLDEDIPTPYYLILSHDDYLLDASALEKAVAIMENNPDVVKIHCDMAFVDGRSKTIACRRFGRNGRIASDQIAKRCILMTRNLFGIPLLIRSDCIGSIRYSEELYYTSDIDFSIALGRGKIIYHIPETFIALRIHQNNNTHRQFNTISQELAVSAAKHNIALSPLDRIVMFGSDHLQRLQKSLFFLYLKFRSRTCA